MIGERGGGFESFEDAAEAMENQRPDWSTLIRATIESALIETGFYHAEDLIPLALPEEAKACVGAQTRAVAVRGYMEETSVRRSTSDPAGHGRRSSVYRITELGREKLRPVLVRERSLGGLETGSRGGSSEKGNSSPRQSAAATSGEGVDTPGGDGPSSAVTALPTLFEPEPVRTGLSHYESEAA